MNQQEYNNLKTGMIIKGLYQDFKNPKGERLFKVVKSPTKLSVTVKAVDMVTPYTSFIFAKEYILEYFKTIKGVQSIKN